ncbi:hypothetical protein LCGC14_1171240 [marine sediment metagenome]|uniref:LamG-like jellyroll fold domain-containing protein n=1 Tax=marine sediment metagenome TaxID=412755 RepID=A0A0F9LUL5_9ZZZZ|nr:hypothetical protein [Pricia sp.]
MFNLRPPGQKPLLGTPLDMGNPLSLGLIGAWLMNEGSGNRIYDISGNGRDGILDSNIEWQATQNGSALYFGTNADDWMIPLTSTDLINLPTSKNFSVVVSCLPNYNASTNVGIAWGGTDDLLIYPNDGVAVDGGIRVFWRACGATLISYAGSNLNGIRVQTVFTAVPGDQRAYQDGVLVGTGANDLSGAGPFSNLNIGGWGDAAQAFGGHIEYVYLYNRVLTIQEIRSLYIDPYQMWPDDAFWMISTTGWAHKWNGIAGASITAINGVPTASITKVNGI